MLALLYIFVTLIFHGGFNGAGLFAAGSPKAKPRLIEEEGVDNSNAVAWRYRVTTILDLMFSDSQAQLDEEALCLQLEQSINGLRTLNCMLNANSYYFLRLGLEQKTTLVAYLEQAYRDAQDVDLSDHKFCKDAEQCGQKELGRGCLLPLYGQIATLYRNCKNLLVA